MGQPRKSLEDVQTIISQVAFQDRKFHLEPRKDGGFHLQVQYMEADVEDRNAGPVLQKARKWYISPYSTDTEVVETAFKAIRISMEHVVREHFTFMGRRVFSPHFDIMARVALCDNAKYDTRLPPEDEAKEDPDDPGLACKHGYHPAIQCPECDDEAPVKPANIVRQVDPELIKKRLAAEGRNFETPKRSTARRSFAPAAPLSEGPDA